MKSLTKSSKDQKIIILNGANEEDIFKKWLDVIGMMEEDFLKFSETDGFEIRKKLLETDHNFYEISMLFKKNNVEEKIAYSFLVKADDAKELGIVVRILLCISEKLDAACKKETLHYYELDFEGYERSDDNDAYALCLKTDIKDLTEADAAMLAVEGGVNGKLTYLREISFDEAEKYFDVSNLTVYHRTKIGGIYKRPHMPNNMACERYRGKYANPFWKDELVYTNDAIHTYMYFRLITMQFAAENNISLD